jgi:uncharacterized membrane protein YccF (DUF307 family)
LKEPTVTTILNVLWLIFGGWISGLLWTLAGCVLAITIIGLPWTPAAFRMASFSFWPFGRHLVDKPTGQDLSLVLNIIWLVFAGWWLALHHVILAVMLGVTIIGIPFALQHLKLAGISLMPVGKDVIEV